MDKENKRCSFEEYSNFIIWFFKKNDLPIDYSHLHDNTLNGEWKYMVFNKVHSNYIWDSPKVRMLYWDKYRKEMKNFFEIFQCNIKNLKKAVKSND